MQSSKEGQIRYIVFKEKNVWYATALEFNIVESTNDSTAALANLLEAIEGYIESCKKVKGSYRTSQTIDIEYEQLWNSATTPNPLKSSIAISVYGVLQL